MSDRRKTIKSPVARGCGCVGVGLGFVVFLGLLVGGVWFAMASGHSVSSSAQDLGLEQGPSFGMDGWYVGTWQGTDVALAATYGFDTAGNAPRRQRRRDEVVVVLRTDARAIGGTLEWTGEAFEGGGTWPPGWEGRAVAFAREHGGLVVSDAGDGPAPFERGVVLQHTWEASVPSSSEVERRLRELSLIGSVP